MKQILLKKITDDHYVVVDDSPIQIGDWYVNNNVIFSSDDSFDEGNNPNQNSNNKKITHSTQPLEWFGGEIIFLSEVKELIGEVDVEKEALLYAHTIPAQMDEDELDYAANGYYNGYTQALEDNKDKKYTERDLWRAFEDGKKGKRALEFYGTIFQPKTEWEVEFDENGKLKLKQ